MDTSTTDSVSLLQDHIPVLSFLLTHPRLPVPRGLDLVGSGGMAAFVDTPEQVAQWAAAVGVTPAAAEHKGSIHHTATTFDPFYVSVAAIVPIPQVTA